MTHRLPIRRTPKRHYIWLLIHVVGLLLITLWLIPALACATFGGWAKELDEAAPAHAMSQLAYLERALERPEEALALEPERIGAIASGLLNLSVTQPALKLRLAASTKALVVYASAARATPYGQPIDQVLDLGDHGLYLSQLNLALGAHRAITQSGEHDALHKRISKHLRALSLRDGDYHAPTHPALKDAKSAKQAYKRPADQATLLASLYLYDKLHKERLSDKPIEGWLKLMQARHTDPERKLHLPTLDETLSFAKLPRGSALSQTILAMHQFAPAQARKLYERYREHHQEDLFGLGLGGLREWPKGVDRGSDQRSGQLILGVGPHASAQGLGAAKLYRDVKLYALIMRTATALGQPIILSTRSGYTLAPMTLEAELFQSVTATRWFGDWDKTPLSQDEGFSVGSAILLFFALALTLFELMSIRERVWLIRQR